MLDVKYNGVIVEDKWGATYLCSACLFAYSDLGPDYEKFRVTDQVYGRYFLHDLVPAWDHRDIWLSLYRTARPWQTDFSKMNTLRLRDEVVKLFDADEMRIWQLTDGWGTPPTDNGIGEGGLSPAGSSSSSSSGSNSSTASAAKTTKPKGGSTAEPAAPAATAKAHEAKAANNSERKPKLVDMPDDLIENSAGVYGYLPTSQSQFHSSKWPVDWTDSTQVSKARDVRLQYHEGLEKKQRLIADLRKEGVTDQHIAKMIVDSRNQDRLSHYKTPESLAAVHQRNFDKYGDKNGPTYESQLDKYGSDEEIIKAALRSNDTMDILTGISKPRGKK